MSTHPLTIADARRECEENRARYDKLAADVTDLEDAIREAPALLDRVRSQKDRAWADYELAKVRVENLVADEARAESKTALAQPVAEAALQVVGQAAAGPLATVYA